MRLGNNKDKKSANSSPSLGGRTFIGIDVSDHAVKMVQISGRSADQIKVESCAVTPLSQGVVTNGKVTNPSELVVTLQQTVNRMGSVSKNVIFGAPNGIVTTQSFVYDPTSGVSLEESASFEATQISALDDINFDFQAVGDSSRKGQSVILALSKKEDLEPYLAVLDEAGLNPALVDVEPVARANAYFWWINKNSSDLEQSAIVTCDIGLEISQVSILQDGAILYKQDFPVGGKHLTRELQRECNVSATEAEQLKVSNSKPKEYQAVADKFNLQIAQEIQRVLQFFYTVSGSENVKKIERIFLTGGGCQSVGIAESVTTQSGIQTQILNPLEYASASGKVNQEQFKQNASRYTVAFGLALRGLV